MTANSIRNLKRYITLKKMLMRALHIDERKRDALREASIILYESMRLDRRNSQLDMCPVTDKRYITRGSDSIVLHGCTLTFSGDGYYYALEYDLNEYGDIVKRFNNELSYRLGVKQEAIDASALALVNEIIDKNK